jgi:hypothetical protein
MCPRRTETRTVWMRLHSGQIRSFGEHDIVGGVQLPAGR